MPKEIWKPFYESPVHLISNTKKVKVLERTVPIRYGNPDNVRTHPEAELKALPVDKKTKALYVTVKYVLPDGTRFRKRYELEKAVRDHFTEEEIKSAQQAHKNKHNGE